LHDQPSAPINEELEDAVKACNSGDYGRAELLCTEILSGNPRHPNTLCLLAGVRLKQNRAKDALDLSAQAVEVAPNSASILADRSDILNRCKLPQEALKSADDSILIDGTFVKAHINRGIALVALYRFAEAKRAFLLASDIDPGWNPVALANTVLLHCEEGRYETARKIADALAHEYPSEHAIALLSARLSMYTPSVTRREEYQRSVSVWDTKTQSIEPLSNIEPRAARPQSKIKIGYFSADFKDHPVSQFLRPVLERHDRKNFEIIIIDVTPIPDDVSQEIRNLADGYHCGVHQTDRALAQSIQTEEVDILVDLTGRLENNRLNTFRFQPAPVQVSWIGYSGASGLPEMNYVLTDSFVCPVGYEEDFSEQVVRLPDHYLCFEPEAFANRIPVMPVTGNVTFGSFNNHAKLNVEVVRVWSEILKRVSGSRLFLKSGRLSDPLLREHIRKQFQAYGITSDRLTIMHHVEPADHLLAYNNVDIALDLFPYCGTTTTVDALAMGVPVVTLVGERWIQRTSFGFLKGMGMESTCAHTVKEYVDIATGMAQDVTSIRKSKLNRRDAFFRSAMCDTKRFTLNLEAAYREMWKAHCEND
jgi:protein O-GlcNAc transferase